MTSHSSLIRRTICLVVGLIIGIGLWGCSAVPRRYVWMAESGVTLTTLSAHPESYTGKTVILGGTIIEEQEQDQYLWLRLMNRPLDQDYVPHRPADSGSSEGGSYWVVAPKHNMPPKYLDWARATVVGRVTGTMRFKTEPVLLLLYMRGWDVTGKHHGVWENINPRYVPLIPGSIDMKR